MERRRFYILILGVLLFTACSKEGGINEPAISYKPTEEQPTNNTPLPIDETEIPIAFSASVDEDKANTRTLTTITGGHTVIYGLKDNSLPPDGTTDFHEGIETNADLKETGFGVYAYYTKDKQIGIDNFVSVDQSNKVIVMLNQKVKWDEDNTKWTYSPMRFWPGNQNYMSFFAYAPWDADIHPSIGEDGLGKEYVAFNREGTGSRDYNYFNYNYPPQIPKSTWTFADQQDLLWGACKVGDDTDSPTGLGGMAYKNIKLSDTDNGTLHWRFRHALARVNFSLYFNFGDFYSDPRVAIPSEREVFNSAKGAPEGKVGGNGNPPVTISYVDEEHPELNGYYVKLNERDGNETLCHKYEELTESSSLVIITGVKFRNYVQSAKLSYDNAVPRVPVWEEEDKTYDTSVGGFSVPSDLLNTNIYKSKSELEALDYQNCDWTTLPHWGQNTNEPLFVLPGEGMAGKTHYTLFVPTNQNLEVVISYKIVRAYKLTGYYTYTQDGSGKYVIIQNLEMGDFTMTGITGHEAGVPETTSTAKINPTDENGQTLGFEPHKSYSVSIHLGKLMRVLYEVTDWDEPESITINVPSFD